MTSVSRQILHVDIEDIYNPGKHIIIVGASGSGKTSALFKVMYNSWKVGDTIIWRDDANLEFISFSRYIPCKVFVPEGCKLHYHHKNVEYVEYDPNDLIALFPQFHQDHINVILFDLFCLEHAHMIQFWVNFFADIYRYKRMRIKESWALVLDEMNDLTPGTRRGVIPGQLRLSSNVYFSMKKFRKMKLKIQATTHNWNDLHPPVRNQFNFQILKSMRKEMVPNKFFNYANKIEAIPIDKVWIVDEAGRFQMDVAWSEYTTDHRDPTGKKEIKLEPKQQYIPFEGEVELEVEQGGARFKKWRERALMLATLALDAGLFEDYKDLGRDFMGLSNSQAHNYFNDERLAALRVEVQKRIRQIDQS